MLKPFGCTDLTASYIRVKKNTYPNVQIFARIGNGGALHTAPGINVAFYNADPDSGGILLGTSTVDVRLNPGEYTDISINTTLLQKTPSINTTSLEEAPSINTKTLEETPSINRDTLEEIPSINTTQSNKLHTLYVVADDDGTGLGTVREIDEKNNKASATFDLYNKSPSITSTPITAAIEKIPYTYHVEASDPDKDPLTYTLIESPSGMSIERTTGIIHWTPLQAHVRDNEVTIQVHDGRGSIDTQSLTITVQNINDPPLITSSPGLTDTDNKPYKYQVEATDEDKDTLTYTLTTSPAGMTIDSVTGLIQWTPDKTQIGSHTIEILANDTHGGSATQSYTLSVFKANSPPQITSTPVTKATQDQPYTYEVDVNDLNSDPIIFSLDTSPDGMIIAPDTGVIQWTPSNTQTGANQVVITVSDKKGAISTQTFTIIVQNVNDPPQITSIPVTTVGVNVLYTYDVEATDIDGDTLTYSLDVSTSGLTIDNNTGLIQWTPTDSNLGDHTIRVRVTDPTGAFDTQEYTISVIFNIDITLPKVIVAVDPPIVDIGDSVFLSLHATDDIGIVNQRLIVNEVNVTLDVTGQATFTPTSDGLYVVVGEAKDAIGNVGKDTTFFRARSGVNNGPPIVTLIAPADDTIIETPVDIIGSVMDQDLVFYELQAMTSGTGNFITFFRGFSSVDTGILGILDPAAFVLGSYDVRVCAEDTWGNCQCSMAFRYDLNPSTPRPGIMSLSFFDGFIDVAGIPIVVRRIYDSRDKTQGDFGMGWRLESDDIKIEANRIMGDDWEIRKVDGPIPTYQLIPSEDHRIKITLPNRTIHRFKMNLYPQSQMLYPIKYLTSAAFEPLPGTTSEIIPGSQPFFIQPVLTYSGPVTVYDFEVYNPPSYILILPDGREFTFINSVLKPLIYKLTSIRDTNGNVISFSENSISHSDGASISINRDLQGRITSLIDPEGKTRTYNYDASGNLVSVTDFIGYATQYIYDNAHNLIQVIDPRGKIPGTLIYDDENRIVGVIDSSGNVVELEHDDVNNQEIVTDRLGNTTLMSYDEHGNLISTIDSLGNETNFTYDDRNNLTSKTDPLGNTETFIYNENRDILTYTDALGNTYEWIYNASGQLIYEIDPLGREILHEYDSTGNETAIITPRGGHIEKQYDSAGNLTAFTDPTGGTVQFKRDRLGRVMEYSDPLNRTGTVSIRSDGQITSEEFVVGDEVVRYDYSYDNNGNLVGLMLPNGKTASIDYNALGLPIKATNTLGNFQMLSYDNTDAISSFIEYNGGVTSIEMDIEGRVTGIVKPGGQRIERTLDPLGRPTRVRLPNGVEITTSYDKAGRIIAQGRTGQGTTSIEYDAVGRVIRSIASDGGVTNYEYDAAGQLTAIVNPLRERTEFAYDPDGNLTRTLLATGDLIKSEYDLVNRLTSIEDERGARLEYIYDIAGQLKEVKDTAGGVTSYNYDEMGNLIKATTPSGNTWGFTYNLLGERVTRTFPWGGTEAYTIDAAGGIVKITDPTGVSTDFEYDIMGLLTKRTLESGEVEERTYNIDRQILSVTGPSGTTNYSYDEAGRVIKIDYPEGKFVEYSYDAAGRLKTIGTVSGTTTYTYDTEGRLISLSDTQVGTATYTYDLAGRVIKAVLPDGSTTTYTRNSRGFVTNIVTVAQNGTTIIRNETITYDPAGNPLQVLGLERQVNYTFDSAGRVISEVRNGSGPADLGYTYDKEWNLLQIGGRSLSYDGTMRLENDGIFTSYTYDVAGRPVTRSNGSIIEEFTYDSLGRLVCINRTGTRPAKVELKYNHANLLSSIVTDGTARNLIWDITQPIPRLLEERDDTGNLLLRYVYGLGPLGIFNGEVKILHQDMLGSIRSITSSIGDVLSTYAFSAYGEQTLGTSNKTSSLRFAGEYFIPELGLYYMRFRFYDPVAGRFFTPDILETNERQPQTFNPYLYAGANPVRFTDPLGTMTIASVPVAFTIINILVSIALPKFPQPVLMIAKALGLTQATGQVGISLAIAIAKSWSTGGIQFDILYGPSKWLLVIWIFAGGQIGTSRGDPRMLTPQFTFWIGPIYGEANKDPGDPIPGVYIMFTGTFAHIIGDYATKGRFRNKKVAPNYSRGAAAIQFKILGVEKTGNIQSSFFQTFTFYGSLWNNVSLPPIKTKYSMNKRNIWSAGISLAVYFPIIWFIWGGQGIEIDNYFSGI